MASRNGYQVTIPRNAPLVALAVVLVGAGAFAVFHKDAPADTTVTKPADPSAQESQGGGVDPTMKAPEMGTDLPPGHPSIANGGGADPTAAPMMAAQGSAPTVTWTTPPTWKPLPNPSAMRLATYRIPRAPGDTDDTDLSVVQAGGTPDANIDRWIGQFDKGAKSSRSTKTVHGLAVTVAQIDGAFQGGGMMGDQPAPAHSGWTMLAAIVETPGTATFFKMVGPAKSVAGARAGFDALIASVAPAAAP